MTARHPSLMSRALHAPLHVLHSFKGTGIHMEAVEECVVPIANLQVSLVPLQIYCCYGQSASAEGDLSCTHGQQQQLRRVRCWHS